MHANVQALRRHQARLHRCRRCPDMIGPPVTGRAVVSPVMLIGQAPGPREVEQRRPFAWIAGKTLFGWFARIGLDERRFRERVYMAAVCRCFPGKHRRGGDRVPHPDEVARCAPWLEHELALLAPALIIPTGKLAITQLMRPAPLAEVVGRRHRVTSHGLTTDVVPLPHPSGASPWHRTEPGRSLLDKALRVIRRHPAWRSLLE